MSTQLTLAGVPTREAFVWHCDVCQRGFRTSQGLGSHYLSHGGAAERPDRVRPPGELIDRLLLAPSGAEVAPPEPDVHGVAGASGRGTGAFGGEGF